MPSQDKYKVTVSDAAVADMDDLWRHIVKTKEDVVYADRLIGLFEKAISQLDTFPRGNSRFSDNVNVYCVHVKKYKVIYAVHNPAGQVMVLRVVHSSVTEADLY